MIRTLVIICIALAWCVAPAQGSWDLASDWSDSSNPNEVWSYGWMDSNLNWTTFPDHLPSWMADGQPAWNGDYPWGVPGMAKSAGVIPWIDAPGGEVFGHTPAPGGTGEGGYLAAKWTAPANMTVDISGAVWIAYEPSARPQKVTLIVNGSRLIDDAAIPATATSSGPYTLADAAGGASSLQNISVLQGQTIILAARHADGAVGTHIGMNLTVSGTAWDLATDWSDAINPAGQWTYGWMDPDMNWTTFPDHLPSWQVQGQPAWGGPYPYGVPGMCKSVNGIWGIPSGRVGGHPPVIDWPNAGDRSYLAARWTAPSDQPVEVSVNISGGVYTAFENHIRTHSVDLLVDGAPKFSDVPIPPSANSSSTYSLASAAGGASNLQNIAVGPGGTVVLAIKPTGSLAGPVGMDFAIAKIRGSEAAMIPTFEPDGGAYITPRTVAISCATPGADIYYTTNGEEPTDSNAARYEGPVLIDHDLTLKARAYKSGLNPSRVRTAQYSMAPDLRIGIARSQSDGTSIACGSVIVTATFGDTLYVEEPDRSAGIQVRKSGHGLAVGAKVDVAGTLRRDAVTGEPYVEASTIISNGTGSVAPVGMTNKSISEAGANKIGLLVKVWGAASPLGGSRYSLSDGSMETVTVELPTGAEIVTGDHTSITGILTLEWDQASGSVRPLVRTRSEADVCLTKSDTLPGLIGTRYEASVPDTLDLSEHAKPGIHHFMSIAYPEQDYEMLWTGGGFQWSPLMACMPKAMEALAMERLMTGSLQDLQLESNVVNMLASHIGLDGIYWVPYYPNKPWLCSPNNCAGTIFPYANVHGQGRMVRAMIAWYQYTGDPTWKELIDRMVNGIDQILVVHKNDYAYFPIWGWMDAEYFRSCYTQDGWRDTTEPANEMAGEEGSLFNHQGHIAGALANWYMLTGNQQALRLSGELARFVTKSKFWPNWPQWSGHFHGHINTLRAVLECGIAANDPYFKNFAKTGYEWARQQSVWARAGIVGDGQGCGAGRLIGLAVKLTNAGLGDYWEDIDVYIRNHGTEMQFTIEDTGNVLNASVGGFGSNPAKDDFAGCASPHGNMGLFYAWDSIVKYENGIAQVNLFLNRASPWLDVDSYLPYEGKVVLRNKQASAASVRIPLWVNKALVSCRVGQQAVQPQWSGQYITVGSLAPGDVVTIEFPMVERTEQFANDVQLWGWWPGYPVGTTFTLTFRGNDLINIDPWPLQPKDGQWIEWRLYKNRAQKYQGPAPMKQLTRFVTPDILSW